MFQQIGNRTNTCMIAYHKEPFGIIKHLEKQKKKFFEHVSNVPMFFNENSIQQGR